MSPKLSRFGLVVALSLAAGQSAMAQQGGLGNQNAPQVNPPVKLTGPAAKKADDLIKGYTARIEKEIEQSRKEIERLRAELHELIDVRYDIVATIAELRGELAAKGTYSAEPTMNGQAAGQDVNATQGQGPGNRVRRDFLYGLGSALPKDPTADERDQLRRLAPRAELKRMVDRLRAEIDETHAEIDQLAYHLLELRSGVPTWNPRFGGMGGGRANMGGGMGGMGGGMGGMGGGARGGMGGMAVPYGQWFGTMGMGGGMGGGMM
jgi:hypothetical protein